MTKLQEGDGAPDFKLKDDDGNEFRLADLKGQKIVLYFYPKDDTPGCTAEAREFQEHMDDFGKKDAMVIGISSDDAESHQKFRQKYGLTFPLLCDTSAEVSKKYGVSSGQNENITRSTFVIGEDGRIVKAMYGVDPEGHAEAVANEI